MTIADVLTAAGHPAGKRHGQRWRTVCPLHGGSNLHAFSYTEDFWTCWACGRSGNAYLLQKALGTLPEPPTLSLGGCDPCVPLRGSQRETEASSESTTSRLSRLARRQEEARLAAAGERHWEAAMLLDTANVVYRYTGAVEMAAELYWEADRLFAEADAVLGCVCSRVVSSPLAV